MQALVVGLAYVGGQRFESHHLRGSPTTLAAYYHVTALAVLLHRNGLYHAQLTDRIGQFGQRVVVELRSRLRGVGVYLRDGYLGHAAHGRGLHLDVLGAEYGIQSAS